MPERANHPSFLELDRFFLGVQTDSTTENHVRACGSCQTYLDQVTADRPVPKWARDLAEQRQKASVGSWTRWKWAFGLAGTTVAVAAVVVLSVVPTVESPEVTAKGAPAVGVYVQRQGRVSLWDGRASVLPGDTLRLKVIPSGYRHLTVLSPGSREREPAMLSRLHETDVDPDKESVLPVAWRVDDEMRDEEIVVVFSEGPLADNVTVEEMEVVRHQSQSIWFTRLVLQKARGSERSR
jgi:hypothetical protein